MLEEKGTFAKTIDVGLNKLTDKFGFIMGSSRSRVWREFRFESKMQIPVIKRVQAVSFVSLLNEKCTSLFGRVVDR